MTKRKNFKKVVKKPTTSKKKAGLYQTPSATGYANQQKRPRYYVVDDISNSVGTYQRLEQIQLARSLFTQCADLGGALLQKSSWVVSPGSFMPIYSGKNEKWGIEATNFLTQQFYPTCNVLGQNYNFQTTLYLSSLALDVDGDSGLFFSYSKSGFPQIGLIPSHRIGQRNDEEIVSSGLFTGYKIYDGVIVNEKGRPIAYRILGEKVEDDKDISVFNMQLLYEPEWADQYRGISRVARSINDWTDKDDIDEFIKRHVKLVSSLGLIHESILGDGSETGFMPGAEEDSVSILNSSGVQVSNIRGGEMYFLKAGANEKVSAVEMKNPTPNTEDFLARIQKRALFSVGWPQELLDPSKIGGASVRLIQDLVRKTIANRQNTLERRAKTIIGFALSTAMKNKLISSNTDDWYLWNFTKGANLTVDAGNENKSDIENYRMGTATLSEIVAKRGNDWTNTRKQNQREVEDLIERAQTISKNKNVPFETALTLLQQSTPNTSPVAQPSFSNNSDNSDNSDNSETEE
jgi:hypothetical protein